MEGSELEKLYSLNLSKPSQKIEAVIKNIKDIFNGWNISILSEDRIQKESGTIKYEIILKVAEFLEEYAFIGRMIFYIDSQPFRMIFETLLTNQDLTPVCIKSPNNRFLVRRHILKLNSLLKYGSFSLDDIGSMKFHLMWNHETNAHLAMRTKDDMEKWMQISFTTTISTLKANLPKILVMTETITMEKYNAIVQVQGQNMRQLPKFFYEDQEKLKAIIIEGVKMKTNNKDPIKEGVKIDPLPEYHYPFYQRVKVRNVEYYGKLTTGGYAAIHVVKAKMEVKELGKDVTKDKYFLVKVPKEPPTLKKPDNEYVLDIARGNYKEPDKRINIERRVISYPSKNNFQHIARYYDDHTEEYQRPMLYMENYLPQNLHEFNSKKDLGMGTKLSWLYQLAHVLLYFKNNNIIHVDLKSSNIVVAKNFFLKVIDFAESILKGVKDFKNDKRATTIPFSSPESLEGSQESITYDSDVFSFAHIAYELIGRKPMIGFKRSSESKVRNRYKTKIFKLLPISNWLNYQGPAYLMQYIYYIIMLCSLPDPSCRFPQELLVNFVKEYAFFTEKLF